MKAVLLPVEKSKTRRGTLGGDCDDSPAAWEFINAITQQGAVSAVHTVVVNPHKDE